MLCTVQEIIWLTILSTIIMKRFQPSSARTCVLQRLYSSGTRVCNMSFIRIDGASLPFLPAAYICYFFPSFTRNNSTSKWRMEFFGITLATPAQRIE